MICIGFAVFWLGDSVGKKRKSVLEFAQGLTLWGRPEDTENVVIV
jgi:hypothetical protein